MLTDGSSRIQTAGRFRATHRVPALHLGMRSPKHAARMRRRCTRQHLIQDAAPMPGFDRVRHKFRPLLFSNNASHAAIIACAFDKFTGCAPALAHPFPRRFAGLATAAPQCAMNSVMKPCSACGSTASGASANATVNAM